MQLNMNKCKTVIESFNIQSHLEQEERGQKIHVTIEPNSTVTF